MKIVVNCFGKVKDTKPIGFSFIRSLLQSRVPERVNYINANVIAKELGIKININYSSKDTNYTNLISAIVRSDDEYVLEGSIFDDNLPNGFLWYYTPKMIVENQVLVKSIIHFPRHKRLSIKYLKTYQILK